MTWFKVDDSFHSHPKAMAAGPAAVGLWTIAGSWSNANLTDGFVPDYMLPRFAQGSQELAQTLVAAGLWRRTRGGYRYHDWGDYQPTRESVLNERQKWADKKAKQRAGKRDEPYKPRSKAVMSPGDTPGDSPGESLGESSPSRSRTRTRSSSNEELPPDDDSLRSSSPPPSGGRRGTRIPDPFVASSEMIEWARLNTPDVGTRETEAFADYWRGVPGTRGTKLDWLATWRNWMRRAQSQLPAARARASPRGQTEINGLMLNDHSIADMQRTQRLAVLDAQQLAIGGS